MNRWICLVAGCASAMIACGGAKPPVSNSANATETTSSSPRQTEPITSQNVTVSADIVARCKIVFGNVERAPKFDFDQSGLTSDDQSVLAQVAKCVIDGPLKGRAIKLVGRADPRGEVEYNMALGARRADQAEQYLKDHGVDTRRLTETSRGKLDATGTDESGWARDRRVDIDLI